MSNYRLILTNLDFVLRSLLLLYRYLFLVITHLLFLSFHLHFFPRSSVTWTLFYVNRFFLYRARYCTSLTFDPQPISPPEFVVKIRVILVSLVRCLHGKNLSCLVRVLLQLTHFNLSFPCSFFCNLYYIIWFFHMILATNTFPMVYFYDKFLPFPQRYLCS